LFVGHFGAGLAAKALAPRVSLGSLFLAAQFIDLAWPTLLLLGVERVRIAPGITAVTPLDFEHYPFTHSLLAVLLWGAGLAVVYRLISKDCRSALVLGALVVSHWLLDLVVHRPDLPLYPGSAKVGLGLWDSVAGTLVVELAVFGLGATLYLRATRSRDRTGAWALWSLLGFLLLVHLGNLLGPPPPSVAAIAWVGQAQWLLVLWGYWIDRHREPS
jgi:hypothetical protein